jgi:4-amino-4-deoxy-L-arabinose transferase-like glycosyltransferase
MEQAAPITAVAITQAERSSRAAWRAQLAEPIAVAALLALAVLVGTWFSQPLLRVRADSAAAARYLSGFWVAERNDEGGFRWSQTNAAIRLFGLEQRAPVLFQARLSASRKPGLPLAQLTIGGETPLRFPIRREWRRYMMLLPAPARGAEGRSIELHSLVDPPHEESRDLGVAIDWFAATQQPRTLADRLPDTGRLAFLVALGLLGYAALRRASAPLAIALSLALALASALGIGIATAPGRLAYWLPSLWLATLAGWLALILARLLPWLRERQSAFTAVAALAAVATGVALLPLQQPWSSTIGWALLVGGSIGLAAALPAWPAEASRLSRRLVALALTGITLLALAARLVGLDALPLGMWRDEARHGLLALRILHDPSFRPVYIPNVADIPALLFYLAAVPIQLFGAHAWSIRLVPALAGALTPLALYFAAQPLFGARAALLAAALLAISAWHIGLSRLAFAATLGPPLTLLAIGLAWRALTTINVRGPESRRQLFEAALAGCTTGLAIYAYHPSRLTPLIVAIAAALRLGWNKHAWRSAAPRLALLGLSAALVAWPLINYGFAHRSSFGQRIGQTSVFNPDSLAGRAPLARVEENVRLNLGLWSERGDLIGRHNLPNAPMLDPLTGVAFAIGAGLTLTRLRDRRALLLALWLGVALVPGIFSIEAPHAVRTVESIAPTMLLAAVGSITLAAGMPQLRRNRSAATTLGTSRSTTRLSSSADRLISAQSRPTLRSLIGAGLLVAALALNGARYFVAWPASPKAYEEFSAAETSAGQIIQRLAAQPEIQAGGYQIYVPDSAARTDVLRYLTSGLALDTFAHGQLARPAGDRALLIDIGDQPGDPQALRQALGEGAAMLGVGPISPLSGRPEWTIYGRGPEAAQAVERALTP